MIKMLIQLDEERIKADGVCDSAKMWAAIDKTFARKECIKEVQPDGSVMYLGNPNRDNLLADFWQAYLSLFGWEQFVQYCSKWKCYDNEDNDDFPLANVDILAKLRSYPPFAMYAPKS